MGLHVRNRKNVNMIPQQQHIRVNNPSMMSPQSSLEKFSYGVVNRILQTCGQNHIQMTPKQSVGWFILGVLLTLLAVFFIGIKLKWFKNPFSGKGGAEASVAPTSHLQYFFF